MRKYRTLLTIFLFVTFAGMAPKYTYASCPWYDPFCLTPTPTPTLTPTPIIFQKIAPAFQFKPGLLTTITPASTNTPTPTATVTPTATLTPTETSTPTTSVTVTPEASSSPTVTGVQTPRPTVTPEQPKALVAGFTTKEVALGGVIVLLLGVILLQRYWGKIKSWLHNKTS
ncbi:MAG TPA: hypothetical protein VMR81_00365 [Patescibacteria group bacterium]|jgi:hypothetical protein|nr:hypothetical protein [Patescibacteria group bacterium]